MTVLKGNVEIGGPIFSGESTVSSEGSHTTATGSSTTTSKWSESTVFSEGSHTTGAASLTTTSGAASLTTTSSWSESTVSSEGSLTTGSGSSTTMSGWSESTLSYEGSPTTGPGNSTTTSGQCYNGATWNGEKCACTQGYFGYQCQSPLGYFFIETPTKINATVELRVKVTNRNFTKDLNNISSHTYQNFVQLFKSQMDKSYRSKDFPQYRGVIIRKLLNGSVMVEHEVVMEADFTSEFQELFANLTKIIKAKVMNETGKLLSDCKACENISRLCYSEKDTFVNETVKLGFDLQEQCTRNAAKEFAQFYYVDDLDGKLACVTKCTPGTKSQMNCHHGRCQLQQSGPHCLCLNSDTHWHWGESCEFSTSKSMVYGIVGAMVVLLVVSVVVLAILLSQSQRKLHRQENNLSRDWQEEDVPGNFQNTGVWEGQNLQGDTFGLENVYRHFQPSLQNVDPTTELHIQRPTVVTTAQ
ncbi:mucin-12 [Balaenoptera acutorostrata]|uniref:Mucin-12 n=1 Tax=Balaenoptera acutorostrata TaxID=9767 RepID=A0ABM3S4M4_BALAC|nr:mucin-12 [Balaenoptera acutorostrata]